MDDDFDNYDFDDDFPSPEVKERNANKNGDVLDELEKMGGFSLDGTNPPLKSTTPVPNLLARLKSGLSMHDKEEIDFA